MAKAREIILPVGINNRKGRGQLHRGLMVVKHERIHPQPLGLLNRLVAGGAAIDRYKQLSPRRVQRTDRLTIGAIALNQPVWNVDEVGNPNRIEIACEQGGLTGAIDIIIAKNCNFVFGDNGIGQTIRRRIHINQTGGIGHQVAQSRL